MKVVLITGCSTGIGRALTAVFSDRGCRVLVGRLQRPDSPAVVRLGTRSLWLPALKRWLPERLLDRITMRRFSRHRLEAPR